MIPLSPAKSYCLRFCRMLLGFSLIALAVVISRKAVSLSPWNVLSDGIAHTAGIRIGEATVWVSTVVLVLDLLSGEPIGIGLVLNALLIGHLTDFFCWLGERWGLLVQVDTFLPQIVLCLLSCFINAFGIYLYLSAGMGGGPRDTLLLFLSRKTGCSVGTCKLFFEAAVCLIGYLTGGAVGIGTFLSVLAGGPSLQAVFHLLYFNPQKIKHESLRNTLHSLLRI